MRAIRILGGALVAIFASVSPVFSQSTSLGVRLPSEAEVGAVGLTRAWWGHAIANPLRDKLLYLTLDDENLYAQCSNGTITCFNNETGQRRWGIQVGLADNPILPLTHNEQFIFASNGSKLYCMKKSNGDIVWNLDFPGSPSSSPAVDSERVYLGMIDGSVYTFDIKKIAKLEDQGLLPKWSNETLMWRYKTSGTIVSPPMPIGPRVVFASETGSIYAVGKIKRDLIFQYKTASKLSAPMAIYKKWLLAPSQDNLFYAISSESGQTKWEYTVGLPIRKTPSVVGDKVYITPLRGGMYQLDADLGTQIWWRPGIEQFLATSPTRVYSRDHTGNVVVLDYNSGSLIGSLKFNDYPKQFVNELSDRLYLGTDGGLIVCLRERAREFPVFHLHPERMPIIPLLAPNTPEDDGPAPPPAANE